MTDTLHAAIRAELDPRLARIDELAVQAASLADEIDRLERMLDLATSLGQDAQGLAAPPAAPAAPPARTPARAAPRKPASPAAPSRPPASSSSGPRAGRDGLGPVAQEVLEAVRELGPGTRVAEIAARTGRSPKAASNAMNRLLERGLVTAEGATSARRYSPVGGGNSPGSLKPKPLPSLAEARAAQPTRTKNGPVTMSQFRAMVLDAITRDPSALLPPYGPGGAHGCATPGGPGAHPCAPVRTARAARAGLSRDRLTGPQPVHSRAGSVDHSRRGRA